MVFRSFFRRSTRYGLNFLATVFVVLGIIILIEFISVRYNKRFDLTAQKMFSLSLQSKKILKSLVSHVEITAFYKKDQPGRAAIMDLLHQYANESPMIGYSVLDPDRQPAKIKRYNITGYGSIAIESGGESIVIESPDEKAITNAIYRLTRGEKKYIYFLKGHGEKDISSEANDGYKAIKEEMEKKDYVVRDLLLMREEKVPESCALLVISGPREEIPESELKKIARYVYHNGKAIFMIDPYVISGLKEFLAENNIILGEDIIVDKASQVYGGDPFIPLISEYLSHPITRDFTTPSIFPLARSVSVAKSSREGIISRSLLKTGPESWAETDKEEVENGVVTFQEGRDKKGPISLAATVNLELIKKEKNEEIKGSFVVYGDSDFIDNYHMNLGGNRDLFLNTVGWLAGEKDLISIRPKDIKGGSFVLVTPGQADMCFWLSLVAEPLFVLLIGIIYCGVRRIRE